MGSEHQASGQVTRISNCKQGIMTHGSILTVIVARFYQVLANKVWRDSQEMCALATLGMG
jgi:hypothetical protein